MKSIKNYIAGAWMLFVMIGSMSAATDAITGTNSTPAQRVIARVGGGGGDTR